MSTRENGRTKEQKGGCDAHLHNVKSYVIVRTETLIHISSFTRGTHDLDEPFELEKNFIHFQGDAFASVAYRNPGNKGGTLPRPERKAVLESFEQLLQRMWNGCGPSQKHLPAIVAFGACAHSSRSVDVHVAPARFVVLLAYASSLK